MPLASVISLSPLLSILSDVSLVHHISKIHGTDLRESFTNLRLIEYKILD